MASAKNFPPAPRNAVLSDSRPRPLQIPGSNLKVRSLIDYFNQKIHEKTAPVTSKPYSDRKYIPSNRVRSLVQNYSRVALASSISSLNSPVTISGGYARSGRSIFSDAAALRGKRRQEASSQASGQAPERPATVQLEDVSSYAISSPDSLRGAEDTSASAVELRESIYRRRNEPRSLNSRKGNNWLKRGKLLTPMVSATGEPASVTRGPTRGEAVGRNQASKQGPGRRLGGSLPKRFDSQRETLRSSSLEVDPSTGTRDTDEESAMIRAAVVGKHLEREIDAGIKGIGLEDSSPETMSKISFSESFGSTFRSVRDSFRKKPPPETPRAVAPTGELPELRIQDLGSDAPEPVTVRPDTSGALDSSISDLSNQAYLTARESFFKSGGPAGSIGSKVRSEIRRLEKLDTVQSETEHESMSREVPRGIIHGQEGGTESGLVEALLEGDTGRPRDQWSERNGPTVDRVRRRSGTYKAASGRGRAGRKPVAGVFPRSRTESPARSPLVPVMSVLPLRVVKAKGEIPVQINDREQAGLMGFRSPMRVDPSEVVHGSRSTVKARTVVSNTTLPATGEVQPAFGTPFSTPKTLTESPKAITVRSPSLMREMAFPPLTLRGEISGGAPGRRSNSSRRQDSGGEPGTSVPKRKIVNDEDWKIEFRKSRRGITNKGVGRIQMEVDHSYDGLTSPSRSIIPPLAPKTNSNGTNSYNIPPPPLTLELVEKYGAVVEENEQYQDYIIEPEQYRRSRPPLKYATSPAIRSRERVPETHYPPFQQWSKGYDPQPIIAGVLDVNSEGFDGAAGRRSLRDYEQPRRGRRRERVNWQL